MKTAEQILSQKDLESFDSTDTTTLQKLILSAQETTRKQSNTFLMIKAPGAAEKGEQD